MLVRVFGKYPSFQRAKVIRDKRTNKTKGFGFVSFKDPQDFIKAMKEINGECFYFLKEFIRYSGHKKSYNFSNLITLYISYLSILGLIYISTIKYIS